MCYKDKPFFYLLVTLKKIVYNLFTIVIYKIVTNVNLFIITD